MGSLLVQVIPPAPWYDRSLHPRLSHRIYAVALANEVNVQGDRLAVPVNLMIF